jgi:hypothetical protein
MSVRARLENEVCHNYQSKNDHTQARASGGAAAAGVLFFVLTGAVHESLMILMDLQCII